MNLYKLSQSRNRDYETYDSCVVAAKDEEEARHIHPSCYHQDEGWEKDVSHYGPSRSWVFPHQVEVELIGIAADKIITKGVIVSSFNSG